MSAIRDLAAFGSLVLVVLLSRAALADEPAPSLQATFDEAQKLAADPAKRDQAIKKLEAVVAAHRANRELYETSLKQLVEHYRAIGREEDGIRYFVKLAMQDEAGKRADRRTDALNKILTDYHLKQPDLFGNVLVEVGAIEAPQERAVQPPIAQDADLERAILQREDQALRDASLAKLREKLAPETPDAVKLSALNVLWKAQTAKFDHEAFRPLVLPLLKSGDDQVRMMALDCLPGVTHDVGDAQAVAALANDPSAHVRARVGAALVSIGGGKATDVVVPALKLLLNDADRDVVRATITAQWGQYPHPELDPQFIALADRSPFHHEAIYFGLSTQKAKSVEVCRRLVTELADRDWNNSGRAAWGLTYGVPEDAHALVEEGLLKALPEETNAYTRGEEFKALLNVASEKSRDYLSKVTANDAETDADRKAAQQILARLDAARK